MINSKVLFCSQLWHVCELPNTIEGMVHISNMTDDYYHFEERQMALIGELSKSI